MALNNICAHTTAFIGDHVDFVSINEEGDGRVSIAVRENGQHATVFLTRAEFMQMWSRGASHFARNA